jgi:hypothetical protein
VSRYGAETIGCDARSRPNRRGSKHALVDDVAAE